MWAFIAVIAQFGDIQKVKRWSMLGQRRRKAADSNRND